MTKWSYHSSTPAKSGDQLQTGQAPWNGQIKVSQIYQPNAFKRCQKSPSFGFCPFMSNIMHGSRKDGLTTRKSSMHVFRCLANPKSTPKNRHNEKLLSTFQSNALAVLRYDATVMPASYVCSIWPRSMSSFLWCCTLSLAASLVQGNYAPQWSVLKWCSYHWSRCQTAHSGKQQRFPCCCTQRGQCQSLPRE